MIKKPTIKIILIALIAICVFVFFWSFINQYLFKPKAATDTVNVTYSKSEVSVNKNNNFSVYLLLNAATKKISAINLKIKFDNADILDYLDYDVVPSGYFDQTVKVATSSAGGIKYLNLVLTANKIDSSLSSSVTVNLSFKAKKDGTTTIALINNESQIAGSASDYLFDIKIPATEIKVIAGSGVANSTPTPTLTPTPTTGVSTSSASISFRVRLQGITSTPQTTTQDIKVVVKKKEKILDSKTITFNYDTTASGSAIGTWIGIGDFNVATGSGYSILMKGPKHVQKKICDSSPSEEVGEEGTYSCSIGALTVTKSTTFDFSKIMLLAGDLPTQDGIVNSYDISLVRNNLGKTDSESLMMSDINLDGRVNTQDYSLIIYALSIRTDEE